MLRQNIRRGAKGTPSRHILLILSDSNQRLALPTDLPSLQLGLDLAKDVVFVNHQVTKQNPEDFDAKYI